MSSLALMEVQKALYSKLDGDGVLMAMVSGVYDAVPQKTALPYVVIGDGDMRVVQATGLVITDLLLQLDVWTEASGRKNALAIMNRLFALLHLGTLTISGFQQVTLSCEQADTSFKDDGTRIHGRLNVRVSVVEV